MAKVSLKNAKYCPVTVTTSEGTESETYGTTATLSKAIRATVTINSTDTTLYADDAIAEYISEFVDGSITFEGDDIEDAVAADIMGATLDSESGEITYKGGDSAKYIRLGFIVGRIKNNAKQYKAIIYTRVKFNPMGDDFETKGQTIVFKTASLSGKIMRNAADEWKKDSGWKDTEQAAQTYLSSNIKPTTGG